MSVDLRELVDAIFRGPQHKDCDAPKITFDGVKTCKETKPEMMWCGKCASRR